MTIANRAKSWEADGYDNSTSSFDPIKSPPAVHQLYNGIFVRVDLATRECSGFVCNVSHSTRLDLSAEPMIKGDAFITAFHTMLTDAGLTTPEAAGLVDCWRPQFFHSPGSRFVLLMSSADYDYLCPIRIDPPPTELVRVGLVLTEFGPRQPGT